jgi:hypothetical protein
MWKSTVASIMFLISAFLVCDPDPDVQSYILTDNGRFVKQVKAQPDGSLKYSVRKAKIGIHRMTITSCNQYGCGDQAASLEFVRPKRLKQITKIELNQALDGQAPQYIEKAGPLKFLNPPKKERRIVTWEK